MPTYKVSWTKLVHVLIEADSSEDADKKWTDGEHDNEIVDAEALDDIRLADPDED